MNIWIEWLEGNKDAKKKEHESRESSHRSITWVPCTIKPQGPLLIIATQLDDLTNVSSANTSSIINRSFTCDSFCLTHWLTDYFNITKSKLVEMSQEPTSNIIALYYGGLHIILRSPPFLKAKPRNYQYGIHLQPSSSQFPTPRWEP